MATYCRVLHALLYGSPRLSWRQIVMINTRDTRESCIRKMIPYVRLLSAMILQQNALLAESLWVSKPIDQICFASMKQDEQGNSYRFSDPSAAQGGAQDEEMVDEEDKTEPAGPRGPKQIYMRPHRELSEDVARFVTCRRVPSYQNFNRSQQEVFTNISAVTGEGREYEARRRNWEQEHQAQL
ncbi:hypothetical protein Hanom_Chr05g00432981 [Helianthus anomalus]